MSSKNPQTLGPYILGKTLGEGASCKVKLAKDKDTGKRCAIKILNPKEDFGGLVEAEINTLM